MRTTTRSLICGLALAGPFAPAAAAGTPVLMPSDTVQDRAIGLLKANLEDLKDWFNRSSQFSKAFADGAKYYCDICPKREPRDVADYLYQVRSLFPDGFQFEYYIEKDRIEHQGYDLSEHDFRIPFYKTLPVVTKEGVVTNKAERVDLVALIHMDYRKGYFRITGVEWDKPPASNMLMLELSPAFALGRLKMDDVPGLEEAKTSGQLYRLGVQYYFHPGKGTNRGNVWLKVGLMAGLRRTGLRSEGLTYEQSGLVLSGLAPQTVPDDAEHRITVQQRVTEVEENVSSVAVEVPIGISKRWSLSRRLDFSMELQLGVGQEVWRKVNGSYVMDQVGTRHTMTFQNGQVVDVMNVSGDELLVYNAAPAAVVDASGERIEFFSQRTSLLDDLESKKKAYYLVGLNPSLFIRGLDENIKYNVGLRFDLVSTHKEETAAPVDHRYFLDDADTTRPSLTALTNSPFQFFAGLSFAVIL